MAVTAESVHSILLELELPAPLEDLRNPTEAFMINIITEFFQRFCIDVATIKRTTVDQNDALRVTNPENASVASLINLREAMFVIGNKIFIKDFSINDLTSPGPKRTRKHLKFIANFTLYARNAMENIRIRTDELVIKQQHVNDSRKKKQAIIEATNKRATEIAGEKANHEKLKRESEIIRDKMEKRKREIEKLDIHCKAIEQERRLAIERNQLKRAEVKKLEEITEQLKAKVVREPELIKSRLRELEEECNNKKQKRTTVQEAIQSKKPLIQNLENALAFVEKQHTKLPEVVELHRKLIENNQLGESLKRQIEEATHLINLGANRDREDEEKVTDKEVKKCEAQCEEKLSKVRNLHNELIAEKKALEGKMGNMETRELELRSERDGIRGRVVELEGGVNHFLRQCQELYIKEIKDMDMIHDLVDVQIEYLHNQLSDRKGI